MRLYVNSFINPLIPTNISDKTAFRIKPPYNIQDIILIILPDGRRIKLTIL